MSKDHKKPEEPLSIPSASEDDPLFGESIGDTERWEPAPPPPTPSWDSLVQHVEALQSAIQDSDWSRTSALSDSLSQQVRDDPFLSTDALAEAAKDSRYASVEKGLPDIPHFDEFGRCPATERKYRPLMRFLFERYFRVQVEGLEHLPGEGRAILVSNHSGVLPYDALMLSHAVDTHLKGRSLRPLIEDLFYHAPVLGPWFYRMGCVRASRENAKRLLQREELILVFPEGYKGLHKPFRERYQLQRFGRGGFVKLALRTGAPIIPVAVAGAEEAHPLLGQLSRITKGFGVPFFPITPTFPLFGPLGLLPLPVPWQIQIGAPIQLPMIEQAQEDPLLIQQLVEDVRGQIQAMVSRLVSMRSWR